MRTLSSESCKEPLLNALNPELWLQVDIGKLSKFAPQSPSSICAKDFGVVDIVSEFPADKTSSIPDMLNGTRFPHVSFQIGDEKIACDRHKIAGLSAPLHAMLNGYFTESFSDDIDLSENNISPSGMRAISDFSKTGSLSQVYPRLLLEILERSLYSDGDERWGDLEKATELDPTLSYAYMNRAASLMRKQDVQLALAEINRILGFKLALECLELRFCFYLALEEYQCAISDVEAILTLCPDYRLFDGRVAASQPRILVQKHVENRTTADCWLQLYDRWSLVDDIGSLSVIYQMLESDAAKGVLYFRQSLLLLRLNCPEAAMRSLQLARQHAPSEPEILVIAKKGYRKWRNLLSPKIL